MKQLRSQLTSLLVHEVRMSAHDVADQAITHRVRPSKRTGSLEDVDVDRAFSGAHLRVMQPASAYATSLELPTLVCRASTPRAQWARRVHTSGRPKKKKMKTANAGGNHARNFLDRFVDQWIVRTDRTASSVICRSSNVVGTEHPLELFNLTCSPRMAGQ